MDISGLNKIVLNFLSSNICDTLFRKGDKFKYKVKILYMLYLYNYNCSYCIPWHPQLMFRLQVKRGICISLVHLKINKLRYAPREWLYSYC